MLPKVSQWSDQVAINPDFGQDIDPIPEANVVEEAVAGLPRWLDDILEKHFPEGDARYDHVRRYTKSVVTSLLAGAGQRALAASRYHMARQLLQKRRPPGNA
ncbi:MAG: hypothetical protein JRE40_13140 [Deltaproteobacteria bacterium]|nr:hypothetical protein [Deltaproteobacteria bacterium]